MSIPPAVSSPTSPGWSRWIERLRTATAGRFTILRELGRGGFAAVFLAQQHQPSRRVAIKLLLPAHLDSEWALEHFRGESQKIAEWRHQSVVTIYEVHEVDDLFFFVMSYVEGGSLHDLIGTLGPLPVPIVKSVLAQTGSALQYAHRQGVTHRDIKPQNVLIDVDGGAVVTDFGISKQSGGPSHTVTGMIFGSPPYMAPEQCENGTNSAQSDQYSLGITVYEMMTGSAPFTGPPMSVLMAQIQKPVPLLRTVRPDCPPELEAAVARMLAKNPADRFPSVAEAIVAAGAAELPDFAPERISFARAAREIATRSSSQVLELLSVPPSLEVGDKIPLRAQVKTIAGVPVEGQDIKWSQDSAAAAKIDEQRNELTALTPGFTTLFVRSGDTEHQVRVDIKPPQAASIQIAALGGPLPLGSKVQLSAAVLSKHGLAVTAPPAWLSDDTRIAVITADGVLTATGAGRTRVRAKVDDVTSELLVDVLGAATAADVRITGAPTSLSIGDSRTLTSVVFDASDGVIAAPSLQWTSSDRLVATVSPAGVVTACAVGTVTITASCDGRSASVVIDVRAAEAVRVELVMPPSSVRVGDVVRLRASARDVHGREIDRAFTWLTDDESIARIAPDGTLTALAEGLSVVSASMDDVTGATAIQVLARSSSATMMPGALTAPPTATAASPASVPPVSASMNAPANPPVNAPAATALFGTASSSTPVVPKFGSDEPTSTAASESELVVSGKAKKPRDQKATVANNEAAKAPVEPSAAPATKSNGRLMAIGGVVGVVLLGAIVAKLRSGGSGDAGTPADSSAAIAANTTGNGASTPPSGAGTGVVNGASNGASQGASDAATSAKKAGDKPSSGATTEPANAKKDAAANGSATDNNKVGAKAAPPNLPASVAANNAGGAKPNNVDASKSTTSPITSGAPAGATTTPPSGPPAAPPTAVITPPTNTATVEAAPAKPATPANNPAAREAQVRTLIRDYADALSARKLDDAVALFPSMPEKTKAGWRAFFAQKTNMQVTYSIQNVTLGGSSATAQVSGVHKFMPSDSKPTCLSLTMQFKVSETGSRWRIDALDQKDNGAKGC